MKTLKKREWTEKQKQRLPKDGYWLEFYNGNFYKGIICYCIMNGYIKYVRSEYPTPWGTLVWTCCPTQHMITNSGEAYKYEHYSTHEEMTSAHPELTENFKEKPINDF